MDPVTASLVAIVAASLLGLVITLLLLYMVIRLGVSHALRSHADRADRLITRR